MKTILCGVCVLVSVVSGPTFAQGTQRNSYPVKGNAYYSVRSDRSRVSLLFKGTVLHAETRVGNTLTIDCSGITAAPSHSASDLNFKDGLVRHLAIGRIENGNARVVVTLKTGTENYDIVSDEAAGIVRLDVFSNPFALKPGLVAQTISPRKNIPVKNLQQESHPQSEPQPIPMIDLSGVVRNQLADALTEKQTQSAPAVGLLQPQSNTQLHASKNAMFWLVGACASLLLTLGTIMVLVRKALQMNMRRNAGQQPNKPQGQAFSIRPQELAPERGAANRRLEDDDAPRSRTIDRWQALEEVENSTISLAEQYRRSQGDIELAIKLREKAAPQPADSKVGVIKAVKMPGKGTVRVAKKNGVGAGELDLAAKLRKLQDAFSEKEDA
jgi:hypothetical protein